MNQFRAVCRSMQRQRQDQRSLENNKAVEEVQQDEEHYTIECEENKRQFKFDNMKSAIFTMLKSGKSQQRAEITYQIDTWSDGDLMSFKVFKSLFPK